MKITNVEAHNVKGLKDVRFDLKGHHLFIVGGKNRQGKTSTLDALLMALCGKSGYDNYPTVPLREGQEKGWVKVSLTGDAELHEPTGLTVELLLRRRGDGTVAEEIVLKDSTGLEASEPRTTLKRLFDLRAFDPLEFTKMKREKQVETLMRLVGLDFTEDRQKQAVILDERKVLWNEGKRQRVLVDEMPEYPDAPEAELDSVKIVEELKRRELLKKALDDADKARQKADKNLATQQKELDRLLAQKEEIERAILNQKTAVVTSANIAASAAEAAASAKETAEASPIEEVQQVLSEVTDRNAKFKANKDKREAEARLLQLRAEYNTKTSEIEAIDKDIEKRLKEATWPLPGMSISGNLVTWNGIPIDELSQSERIVVSVAVGMKLNPKLKLLVSQDGNALDVETIEALDQILEKHDFQMIVEFVTHSKDDENLCSIVIRDGVYPTVDSLKEKISE